MISPEAQAEPFAPNRDRGVEQIDVATPEAEQLAFAEAGEAGGEDDRAVALVDQAGTGS